MRESVSQLLLIGESKGKKDGAALRAAEKPPRLKVFRFLKPPLNQGIAGIMHLSFLRSLYFCRLSNELQVQRRTP